MKKLLLVLALLAGRWASAQTTCPPPQLQAFHEEQQIQTAGSAFTPAITLKLVGDPACPAAVSYQIKKVEMTVVRGRRPVLPARDYEGATIDLADFAKHVRPGDRIYMEFVEMERTPTGGQPDSGGSTAANPALSWILTK